MHRDVTFGTGLPASSCGLQARTNSECDEGDSDNFESSETDAAGEQPSFERPAYSSFTSQQDDSSRGDVAWCQKVMYGSGSAFAKPTGNLSDDSDDERNARTAQPTRQQCLPQQCPPFTQRNNTQDLLGIFMAPTSSINPPSLRPSGASGAGNAADSARADLAGIPSAQRPVQQQHYHVQAQAVGSPPLQSFDSDNLPDVPSLLQTLGSRSHPYGVGLVPAEVIRAQLILSARASQAIVGNDAYVVDGRAGHSGCDCMESVAPVATAAGASGRNTALTEEQHLQVPLSPPPSQQQQPQEQQLSQQEQPQQKTSPAVDPSGSFLLPPLSGTSWTSSDLHGEPPPPPPQQQQEQQQQQQGQPQVRQPLQFGISHAGAAGLPLMIAGHIGPGTVSVAPESHRSGLLENRPSFTGNNDELIAAMAAAGLGPAAASGGAPSDVMTTTAAEAAAVAVAAAATPATAAAEGTAGPHVNVSAGLVDAVRPSPVAAAALGGRSKLSLQQPQPQRLSSGGMARRQRRNDSCCARGSSSGMAEFPDEAALAGSIAGSVSGSAPGTPTVSPNGTARPPPPPWSASSSTRWLQSYNMSPTQPQLQQEQHHQAQQERQYAHLQQQQQQQVHQHFVTPCPTQPSSYSYAPPPSPEPRSSPQLRPQQRGSSAGGAAPDFSGVAAPPPANSSAAPAISVADRIVDDVAPSGGGPPPAALSFPSVQTSAMADHPASPFALATPIRSLGVGSPPFAGPSQIGDGGQPTLEYRRPLSNLQSRDTASRVLSGAECCSGSGSAVARYSLGGGGSGGSGNLGRNSSVNLSRGFSGGDGSISGCGLSGLTLGNSTGGGSVSIGYTGSGGGGAVLQKRSRVQPAKTSCLQAVGSGSEGGNAAAGNDDGGGSSDGGGDDDGSTAVGAGRSWKAEELPPPVAVMVTGFSREVGEEGRRRRITIQGVFHPDRYLANQDCIFYENKFISRSAFEKAGGSTTAKWHCSIKVAGTHAVTLGSWLSAKGLPVIKGGSRKSKRQRAVEQSTAVTSHLSQPFQQGLPNQRQPQQPLQPHHQQQPLSSHQQPHHQHQQQPLSSHQQPHHQHQQQLAHSRGLSNVGSLPGALPPSPPPLLAPPGAVKSPRHSGSGGKGGGGGVGGSSSGISGVSLASWSRPQQQLQQPLMSPRQEPPGLPHLHPHQQVEVTSPGCGLQPLRPLPSPQHSGQVHPLSPSQRVAPQQLPPAAALMAVQPCSTIGSSSGSLMRTASGYVASDIRVASSSEGRGRSSSTGFGFGLGGAPSAAHSSAPLPGSHNIYHNNPHQQQQHNNMYLSFLNSSSGSGSSSGGGGGGVAAPAAVAGDERLQTAFGATGAMELYSGVLSHSKGRGGAPALAPGPAGASVTSADPRLGSLPQLTL